MNEKRCFNCKITITLLLLPLLLVACDAVFSEPTLQEEIHSYMYANQPVDGMEFVRWANRNLAAYTDRKVYQAILDEAAEQVDGGHPNAVATLSLMALAWSQEKNLSYRSAKWIAMQEEAIENLEERPTWLGTE